MAKKWIQNMHMKKGALHKALHVPEGKKIPMSKIHNAEHSGSKLMRKRARLADTMKHMGHGKKHAMGGAIEATDGPRLSGVFQPKHHAHHGGAHPVYYGDGGHAHGEYAHMMGEHHHPGHKGHHMHHMHEKMKGHKKGGC